MCLYLAAGVAEYDGLGDGQSVKPVYVYRIRIWLHITQLLLHIVYTTHTLYVHTTLYIHTLLHFLPLLLL